MNFIKDYIKVSQETIKHIDAQVKIISSFTIPKILSDDIKGHFNNLKGIAGYWNGNLRSLITISMQGVLDYSCYVKDQMEDIDKIELNTLTILANDLSKKITKLCQDIDNTNNNIESFLIKVNDGISLINTDNRTINNEIATINQKRTDLQKKIKAQEDKIRYYNKHPFKLILDGLTIIGLYKDLKEILSISTNYEKERERYYNYSLSLNSLNQVNTTINTLCTSLHFLQCTFTNLHTSVSEAQNVLINIDETKIITPIIKAQLKTFTNDLLEASEIANEVLS